MKIRMIHSFAFLVLFLGAACGKARLDTEDDADANGVDLEHPYGRLPRETDVRGERNFAELLNRYSEGRPERPPWVGYWWPYTANGIASGRSGSGGSPAGKYDAARGGRTSAQAWEVRNHGSGVKGVQGWWGHCNGWCVASALFPEPREETRVNGIRFSIADIKALLTEAGMEASADFFGNRVDYAADYNSPKYDDTIPAQYFLVLTNYMGKLKQTVLIDRYTGNQVWNQPLAGYRFQYPKREDYLGNSPEAPSIYRINLTSQIWWGRDDVAPGAITLPFEFEENQHFESRVLKMELWLDGPVVFDEAGRIVQSGNVVVARKGDYLVGGAWRNGTGFLVDAHPDYMWVPFSVVRPNSADPYGNVHIESDWVLKHALAGVDDPTASPTPIRPAPEPQPSRTSTPLPEPSVAPRPSGGPRPTGTPQPAPSVSAQPRNR